MGVAVTVSVLVLMFLADHCTGSNGARVGEQAEVGGRIATSYRGEGRGTTYRPARVAFGRFRAAIAFGSRGVGVVCVLCAGAHMPMPMQQIVPPTIPMQQNTAGHWPG